jgi:hypothetical protein
MNTILENVLALPSTFRSAGDKTVVQLLRESGYGGNRDTVTVAAVVEAIGRDPSIADAWRHYSEDQRSSGGWYIIETREGAYEVGFYPSGPTFVFNDPVLACAEFIVREVEAMAQYAGL